MCIRDRLRPAWGGWIDGRRERGLGDRSVDRTVCLARSGSEPDTGEDKAHSDKHISGFRGWHWHPEMLLTYGGPWGPISTIFWRLCDFLRKRMNKACLQRKPSSCGPFSTCMLVIRSVLVGDNLACKHILCRMQRLTCTCGIKIAEIRHLAQYPRHPLQQTLIVVTFASLLVPDMYIK